MPRKSPDRTVPIAYRLPGLLSSRGLRPQPNLQKQTTEDTETQRKRKEETAFRGPAGARANPAAESRLFLSHAEKGTGVSLCLCALCGSKILSDPERICGLVANKGRFEDCCTAGRATASWIFLPAGPFPRGLPGGCGRWPRPVRRPRRRGSASRADSAAAGPSSAPGLFRRGRSPRSHS